MSENPSNRYNPSRDHNFFIRLFWNRGVIAILTMLIMGIFFLAIWAAESENGAMVVEFVESLLRGVSNVMP